MFTVLDEYTREALCVAVRSKMNANDVLETLHPLLIKHGKPEFIRSDNGPEFIATHLQDWLKKDWDQTNANLSRQSLGMWSDWKTVWDTVFPTHDTTNALTAPCEKKSSTQNGSTPHGKPRSLSMFGSGNTTRSDLITH